MWGITAKHTMIAPAVHHRVPRTAADPPRAAGITGCPRGAHQCVGEEKGTCSGSARPPRPPRGSAAWRCGGWEALGWSTACVQSLGRALITRRPHTLQSPAERPWLRGRLACAPSSAAPRAPRSSTTRSDTRNTIQTDARRLRACRTTAGRNVSNRGARRPHATLFCFPRSFFESSLLHLASDVPGASAPSPHPSILYAVRR